MRFDDYDMEGLESLEFSLPKIKINVGQLFNRVKNFITGNKDKIQKTIAIWRPPQPTQTVPPRPVQPTPRTTSTGNWLIPLGLLFGLYLVSRR